MKISVILSSFNRPTLVQQALKSIAAQTHRDFELLVADDSTLMDVRRLVDRFSFPSSRVFRFKVDADLRRRENRLSIGINHCLREAKGELISYLADDDYYYPSWFAEANTFFVAHPNVVSAFGTLFYSRSLQMDYSTSGLARWSETPVEDPMGKLDHNQVIHRKTNLFWPESFDSVECPDGLYFRELAKIQPIRPINASAAVKRLHTKNLQDHLEELRQGKLDNLRD